MSKEPRRSNVTAHGTQSDKPGALPDESQTLPRAMHGVAISQQIKLCGKKSEKVFFTKNAQRIQRSENKTFNEKKGRSAQTQ